MGRLTWVVWMGSGLGCTCPSIREVGGGGDSHTHTHTHTHTGDGNVSEETETGV